MTLLHPCKYEMLVGFKSQDGWFQNSPCRNVLAASLGIDPQLLPASSGDGSRSYETVLELISIKWKTPTWLWVTKHDHGCLNQLTSAPFIFGMFTQGACHLLTCGETDEFSWLRVASWWSCSVPARWNTTATTGFQPQRFQRVVAVVETTFLTLHSLLSRHCLYFHHLRWPRNLRVPSDVHRFLSIVPDLGAQRWSKACRILP